MYRVNHGKRGGRLRDPSEGPMRVQAGKEVVDRRLGTSADSSVLPGMLEGYQL